MDIADRIKKEFPLNSKKEIFLEYQIYWDELQTILATLIEIYKLAPKEVNPQYPDYTEVWGNEEGVMVYTSY